tara:strand:+ start:469 stop:1395 length:927 start_codon:yes stop_codon:yes gene_type:complete
MIKKVLIILIFFIFIINNSFSLEIKIKAEIDNIIITNVDIEKEKKYLFFLNPKLKELNEQDLNKVAKNSLVREIIKEKELRKFFDLNKTYSFVEKIEKNLLLKKNINKEELIIYLNNNNMNYLDIKNKIKMEALWNQLIYKKYFKNIKIDKSKMRKNIENQFKNTKKKYEYNLSEIVFEDKANENYEKTINKINNKINEIGFENTANILSISTTSKNGGLIGWISELQISEKIKNNLENLRINEISDPIKITNGYIIIKLNNKRELIQKIDIEKELKKLVENETNRQLNNFSIIFYKRLKQNTEINEY